MPTKKPSGSGLLMLTGHINEKHGYRRRNTSNPIYNSWRGMIDRCKNKSHVAWRRYGGRGIGVCSRWRNFVNFLLDMGPSYRPGLTLDRKNGNRGYCKSNCRWATDTQQARNSRRTRQITFNGKTMCVTEWAESVGLTYNVLRQRIGRLKWSFERAISTPFNQR